MTSPQELDESGLREYLVGARERVSAMKQRVRSNEARIRSLETGEPVIEPSWDDARTKADRVIAAITALEVGVRSFSTPGLDGDATEGLLKAFPEFDQSDVQAIVERGTRAEFGAVNFLQGYLGEERALAAINSGAVPVPEGRNATLAESSNQPGYDLRLLSENGAEDLVAQVKVSDSADLIREHFARYPDVNIVYTNSEAAQAMVGDAGITVLRPGDVFPDEPGRYVVDIGVTKDEIRSSAADVMSGSAADGADGVSFGDQLQENIPWIALMVIAGRAAYEFFDTDTDASVILRAARNRMMQSLLAFGVSTAATVATTEPVVGTIAGLGTLFGGRAVGRAREDIRYATGRLKRMGTMFSKLRPVPGVATAS
jgi:hypothetical protein